MNRAISIQSLTRKFVQGSTEIIAVDHVSMNIDKGEFATIVGASGSGKTTLLNLIGCVDQPTSGKILLNNQSIVNFNDAERSKIRRTEIGFIHQDFQLLPFLTAEENIALPALLNKQKPDLQRIRQLADKLGITDRLGHFPGELSGGQQQRVAIARALIIEPEIILADEPTGNLDKCSADEIMDLLCSLNRLGTTFLLVTHNESYAQCGSRRFCMTDGKVKEV